MGLRGASRGAVVMSPLSSRSVSVCSRNQSCTGAIAWSERIEKACDLVAGSARRRVLDEELLARDRPVGAEGSRTGERDENGKRGTQHIRLLGVPAPCCTRPIPEHCR